MISYGTFQKSAAWKLYAKAKVIPFEIANAVSDQLKKYEMAVKHAEEDEKDTIDVQDFIEPQYVDIFNDSKEYMGLITSWSIAPCSYLLYAGNIRREIGLVKIKDHVCCLMDGAWAEKKHFLKNDLLKVSVVELIYKSYHAAGMEPPDVNDLLKMAPPEDDCWQMYAKSCVKGLNQVEQPGTSSRVAKYAPKNISEMCAFVAAIRPGFKSMYKAFESREPFSYGVKQFDDLIQTEEMPNSFLLYQEHIMTALNYAGIPMSECYTAIKNIAKKRSEKVLAYKDKFITGLITAIVKDGKTESEAKAVAGKLWQIIEDSASYSFNCCLTGDTKIACSDGDYSIKELYDRYNNGTYKRRNLRGKKEKDKRIYGKALSLTGKDIVCPNVIVDIRPAGEQPIYVITTKKGQTVSCTGNHKFPTPIGELPCSLLFDDDALYDVNLSQKKPYYYPHMSWIASIEKTDRVEQTYDVEMAAPNHNFVLDNGLIVSNSHSYCVSLDSLYSAWIKAHYPLAFYETLLQITESKGDKDKLVEIKHEAEDYFNITFPSFKFGQDNRAIRANTENNSISNSLTSIKNMPKATSELLWQVAQSKPTTMIDVLIQCGSLHVSDAAIRMLAKIGYFDAFGNIPEIMRIIDLYDFFNKGMAKTVSKKKELAPELFEIVKKYATDRNVKGEELASYTITNPEIDRLKSELTNLKKAYKKAPDENLAEKITAKSEEIDSAICTHEAGMLREMEAYILSKEIEDLDYANKIQNQIEILGYVDLYSGKEEDRRKLFVEDIRPLKDKKNGDIWCYRIDTRSIGSGKTSSLTVPVESYKEYPIKKNDIISVPPGALKKNRKGYWYLYFYDKVYA